MDNSSRRIVTTLERFAASMSSSESPVPHVVGRGSGPGAGLDGGRLLPSSSSVSIPRRRARPRAMRAWSSLELRNPEVAGAWIRGRFRSGFFSGGRGGPGGAGLRVGPDAPRRGPPEKLLSWSRDESVVLKCLVVFDPGLPLQRRVVSVALD